jgi:hypothetical protein
MRDEARGVCVLTFSIDIETELFGNNPVSIETWGAVVRLGALTVDKIVGAVFRKDSVISEDEPRPEEAM